MTAIQNQIASIEIDNLNLIIYSKPKEDFKKLIEINKECYIGPMYEQYLHFNFGFSTKKIFNDQLNRYSISLFNPFYVKFLTELIQLTNLFNNQALMDDLTRKVCLLFNKQLEERFIDNDEFIVFDFYLIGPISIKQKLNVYWMKFCNLFNND